MFHYKIPCVYIIFFNHLQFCYHLLLPLPLIHHREAYARAILWQWRGWKLSRVCTGAQGCHWEVKFPPPTCFVNQGIWLCPHLHTLTSSFIHTLLERRQKLLMKPVLHSGGNSLTKSPTCLLLAGTEVWTHGCSLQQGSLERTFSQGVVPSPQWNPWALGSN